MTARRTAAPGDALTDAQQKPTPAVKERASSALSVMAVTQVSVSVTAITDAGLSVIGITKRVGR